MLQQTDTFLHVSCGALFRDHIRAGTAFGESVKARTNAGIMTSCDETGAMLFDHLNSFDGSVVLDGFPRTVKQVELLHGYCNRNGVRLLGGILLEIDSARALARIAERWVCERCSRSYHPEHTPPLKPSRCDADGGMLVRRVDDCGETALKRLHTAWDDERSALAAFEATCSLVVVDGSGSPAVVQAEIVKAVSRWKSAPG